MSAVFFDGACGLETFASSSKGSELNSKPKIQLHAHDVYTVNEAIKTSVTLHKKLPRILVGSA